MPFDGFDRVVFLENRQHCVPFSQKKKRFHFVKTVTEVLPVFSFLHLVFTSVTARRLISASLIGRRPGTPADRCAAGRNHRENQKKNPTPSDRYRVLPSFTEFYRVWWRTTVTTTSSVLIRLRSTLNPDRMWKSVWQSSPSFVFFVFFISVFFLSSLFFRSSLLPPSTGKSTENKRETCLFFTVFLLFGFFGFSSNWNGNTPNIDHYEKKIKIKEIG